MIEEFHAKVDAIHPHREGYRLSTNNQDTVDVKKVVMCLGSQHGSFFPQFARQRGFVDHHSQFVDIPEGPVLIAGSGLSAVDAVRSLSINRNCEVHLFSRHGYAPTCLTSKNTYTPTVLNWGNLLGKKNRKVRLSCFVNLLHQERHLLPDGGEIDPALRILKMQGVAPYFDSLMARSAAADLPYQDILVSTRSYMHKLWQAMPMEDKLMFTVHHGSAWAAWRHPIPHEVMFELAKTARDGRLYIHKSQQAPSYKNGLFSIETDTGRVINTPFMIDGTGGSSHLETINSPLLSNLLQQGLIEPHPCGGMDVHPLTFQCRVKGKPVRNLYNIGPLNKGSLFSTNAFWFNARCAGQWAKQYVIEMDQENLAMA